MYLNYYIYILFLPMMLMSILLTMISNSWLSLWMMMEINLISMIMLLLFDKQINLELLMKYFLFQSMQSYLYLVNSLNLINNNFIMMSLFIMNFTMLMKLSMIPFHFWYIKIMYKLNWNNLFMFSIINKLIPLYILNNILLYNNKNIMYFNYFMLIMSSMMSSIIGLNQMSLKLIISYSSMIQINWIILMMFFSELISLIYFMIYSLISLNMFMMFYILNINFINQINNMKFYYNNMYLFIMMFIMSLSGLPPFFGFLMKWITIQWLINLYFNFYYILIFIFNSLISMFFYMRIMFNIIMNYYMINKLNIKFMNMNLTFNFKIIYLNWLMMILIIIYMLM